MHDNSRIIDDDICDLTFKKSADTRVRVYPGIFIEGKG